MNQKTATNRLVKIGVFYDGNYFLKVSNYYSYEHERQARISIGGLHSFIKNQVSELESVEVDYCHVVDSHFFRGRLNAVEARDQNKLFNDRIFDDILMNEGVITHYLPIRSRFGKKEEKGIDVWLALEAFELTLYKNFDVVVLIACDGDYVPLVRKLNTMGVRVMLLSWDFKFTDDFNIERETRTSQDLLEEVTYPVIMHNIIDNRLANKNGMIDKLFVSQETKRYYDAPQAVVQRQPAVIPEGERHTSVITTLRSGYGFIAAKPQNLFFSYADLVEGVEFMDLREGDVVEFSIGTNEKGEKAEAVKKLANYHPSQLNSVSDEA